MQLLRPHISTLCRMKLGLLGSNLLEEISAAAACSAVRVSARNPGRAAMASPSHHATSSVTDMPASTAELTNLRMASAGPTNACRRGDSTQPDVCEGTQESCASFNRWSLAAPQPPRPLAPLACARRNRDILRCQKTRCAPSRRCRHRHRRPSPNRRQLTLPAARSMRARCKSGVPGVPGGGAATRANTRSARARSFACSVSLICARAQTAHLELTPPAPAAPSATARRRCCHRRRPIPTASLYP